MFSEMKELSEEDLVKICQSFYEDKFKKNEKIELKLYQTNPLSEVPCGFSAQHNILTVTFKCEGAEHTTDFFVKTMNKNLKEYIEEYGVFKKELGIYQEIIPKLKSFSSIKWAPECYLAKENDVVVFENLHNSAFEMVAKNNGLFDAHHMIVAVGVLAAFHASSIIYEKHYGVMENEDWFPLLEENVYPCDPKAVKNFTYKLTVDTLSELLKRIPKYKDTINDILPIFRPLLLKMFDFVKPSKKYRNVFSHADLWGNNFLFKYAVSSNGINVNEQMPVEAILIDFQLSRYAPPALDFMVMLTINSNSDFRNQYFQRLCDVYYNQLTFELNNHSIDIDAELSRKEFDESCAYYRIAALIESCSFSIMTLLPEDLLSSVMNDPNKCNSFMTKSKTEISLEAFKIDENYRYRISDMLIELVDKYVLK